MKKGLQDFISAILVILGFVFLLPFLNITGNVVGIADAGISEATGKIVNSVLGLVLVAAGAALFLANGREGRGREEGISPLVEIVTREFRKIKEQPTILLDAEFLMTLYKKRATLPQNFFGNYQVIVPSSVYDEVTRRQQSTGKAGVSKKFLNNLRKNYNVTIDVNINPGQEYREDMMPYWEECTPQGKLNNPFERKKFEKGADSEMLAYAYKRDKTPTVIITENYSEIGNISDELRDTIGVNVRTYRTSDVLSGIA